MTTLERGRRVVITDAVGREVEVIALSDVESAGHAFPIVWVERPMSDGTVERAPWPADSVRPA